jgi:S-layer homology domain
LRQPVVAFVLAIFVAVGLGAAPVLADGAPAPDLKVVIIVGPVEGTTSSYRADADEAYAEAIKYTSDVTKVYSPNATWAKVKAATTGASLVIYLGHGNGWPSPYTYDPAYKTKDGFGLNAAAGKGDSNNTYYGEPSVATLDLAPDAVILLNHLCYASGNSEPGNPAPTQTVARQRVDNFGVGFLKAGASAVIADGHDSLVSYIRALFTTSSSIVDLWRTSGDPHGNEASFASTRTPGATDYTDTDSATTGYYRSLVARPDISTEDVLAGAGSVVHEPPPAATTPFTDTSTSKFAADIDWLYTSGLTSGCSATKFCPVGQVTRGQMASFLARALDLPAAAKDSFRDDAGNMHEADINRLAAAGLTSGCASGRYCPNEVVSRGQMASFLARALDLPAATKDYFRDDNGSVHESNIDRLAKAGLTSGCGTGLYCPTSAVTRGQMAAFLHRAFGD